MDVETNDNVYFLNDEPLSNLGEYDAFGHKYYAQTLYNVICNTSSKKSYVIGLFGKWGVGKTSIINELENILGKDGNASPYNYTIKKFDAWKYSEHNFRREFLLDLGFEFGKTDIQSLLSKKEIIENKSHRKLDRNDFNNFFKAFFATLLLGTIIYYLLVSPPENPILNRLVLLTIPLISGIISVFHNNIKDIFRFQTVILEKEPPIHPDQFKNIFKEITKSSVSGENDRLIIVLDNLDRLNEDVAIQILRAVKTFLNKDKYIYIIPCDDKALKQYVINNSSKDDLSEPMTESQANEYLRKFFYTTLTVRTLLTDDLDVFVDHTLSKLKIFDDINNEFADSLNENTNIKNREEMSFIFRIAITKNPRRIIQLSNKLSTNYLLAKEKNRENSEFCINIISNIGFLAKVTVIEEEWPNFYDLIVEYPDILRGIRDYFITESDFSLPYPLSEIFIPNDSTFGIDSPVNVAVVSANGMLEHKGSKIRKEWNNGLNDFLRKTNNVYSDNVSDFLLFKQRPCVSSIANYYSFRDAMLNKEGKVIEESIKNERTNMDVAFKELCDELDRQFTISNITNCVSIVNCIIRVFDLIPRDKIKLKTSMADKLFFVLSKQSFSSKVMDIDFHVLLSIFEYGGSAVHKNQFLTTMIDAFEATVGDSKLSVLYSLIGHPDLLNKELRLKIYNSLVEKIDHIGDVSAFAKFANECLLIDMTLTRDIIPYTLAEKWGNKYLPVISEELDINEMIIGLKNVANNIAHKTDVLRLMSLIYCLNGNYDDAQYYLNMLEAHSFNNEIVDS